MVPLAYVDRVYSEKLRKLTNETRIAKRAIKLMQNRLIDAEQKHLKTIEQLQQENCKLRQNLNRISSSKLKQVSNEDSMCDNLNMLDISANDQDADVKSREDSVTALNDDGQQP